MAVTGSVSGKDATITYVNGYVAKCTAWTLDIAVEDVDTSEIGDDWRTRTWGLQEWSGTFTTQIDTGSSGGSTTGGFGTTGAGTAPRSIGVGIAPAAANFIFDEPAGTAGEFTGSIMITGVSNTISVGGGATVATFTFVGSDTLTLTKAA